MQLPYGECITLPDIWGIVGINYYYKLQNSHPKSKYTSKFVLSISLTHNT